MSVCTSAKKLKTSEKNYNDIEVKESFGYRFIDFVSVFCAISQVAVCKNCKSDVTFTETGKRSLGYKIVISCPNCDQTIIPNCPSDKAYEINCRIVIAMRLLGIGLNGIEKFCVFMDLPRPIFHSFYDKIIKTISIATSAVREKSMKKAAENMKKKCH